MTANQPADRADAAFSGTIDLFPSSDPERAATVTRARQDEGHAFAVMATRVRSPREWKQWVTIAGQCWSSKLRTVAAAILTAHELYPGRILSIPESFQLLLIPHFTELPMHLPFVQLLDFIRNTGGVTALLPPLKGWASEDCGLLHMDLCTVMVNGKMDLTTAQYHLNRRRRIGFLGVNHAAARARRKSVMWLFPGSYKLNEYAVLRSLKQGAYSLSNRTDTFVKLAPDTLPLREHTAPLRCHLSASTAKHIRTRLHRNGTVCSEHELAARPQSKTLKTAGKGYYFLAADEREFTSLSAPLFLRSPNQLWGDTHVHYAFLDGLIDARLDFIVHGYYGQVKHYITPEAFPGIVPGGEIHGITDRGDPANLHFVVLQSHRRPHPYTWEPGPGAGPTLAIGAKYRDFLILAHPGTDDLDHLPRHRAPNGIEVLHGFSLFVERIRGSKRLTARADAAFGPEFRSYLAIAPALSRATRCWDTLLSRGHRVLGVGGGDIHGLAFHGQFAAHMSVGTPVTIVNAAQAETERVCDYFRDGNAWCTSGAFCELTLMLNRKAMGQVTAVQTRNRLDVAAESCFPIQEIRLISGGQTIRTFSCDARRIKRSWMIPAHRLHGYLRAELVDSGGHVAIANPVYLK